MSVINGPVVSVIIPVYNVDPYLRACLDSVLAQTLCDIEIICVNDGSRDHSRDILEKYLAIDERIRIIDQENQGLSKARNIGAEAATGQYLYFLDSDDILNPGALEALATRMAKDDLDILLFNGEAFGEDPHCAARAESMNRNYFYRLLNETGTYRGIDLIKELFEENSFTAPVWLSMVSRRYFLEKELWFHVGILHEDEPYTFKALLYADRAGCANKTFYYNRVRENSITTSKSSFARAYGCFAGALDCGEAMSSLEEKGYDIPELLFKQVMRLNGTAVIRYAECTEEEKDKRKQLSLPDRILFEQTVVSAFELKRKLESEKERTQQYKIAAEIGYRNIRNSYSFKLGRALTWAPRKARDFFKTPGTQKSSVQMLRNAPVEKKNRIEILPSDISGNQITYRYSVEGEWRSCFHEDAVFEIAYPFSLEEIPESIRILPFLSQILPVAWITDAKIRMPFCDMDFFEAIEDVKKGYENMYPMVRFGGKLCVGQLEENRLPEKGKSIACFSGGLDSLSTVIGHINEKPTLVSLWGADIPFDDPESWASTERVITDDTEKLGLKSLTVHTSFRKLLKEGELCARVRDSGDGWWHGFQHGLGILGHMAPIAWAEKAKTVYIAASFTDRDSGYTCASDPSIDNHVKFCGAKVVHDGFNVNRQQKVQRILEWCEEHEQNIMLQVCWKSHGKGNCCHCEKCCRTMLELITEKTDPKDYGFPFYYDIAGLNKDLENDYSEFQIRCAPNYRPIQERLQEMYSPENCPNELLWLYKGDLRKIQDGTLRLHEGRLKEKAWLLGTPEHGNLGDHLIAECEKDYLEKQFPDLYIEEISISELKRENYRQLEQIRPEQTVFLQGGGNIGNLWKTEEDARVRIIRSLPANRIVIFPQSIFFTSDNEGRNTLSKARITYTGDNIFLFCRDMNSYQFAKENFSCRILLAPDMVMWKSRESGNALPRYGAMTILRTDKERTLSDEEHSNIFTLLKGRFPFLEIGDTVLPDNRKISGNERTEKILELTVRISSKECVVTDRLHGMLLCAVTGTPCVALDNSNNKVSGCYEWIKDLDYIQFVRNPREIATAIQKVCKSEIRQYPEKAIQQKFDDLTILLKELINEY